MTHHEAEDKKVVLKIFKHKIRVKSVKIDGLRRVKEDVIVPHLKPMLKANNLTALVDMINTTNENLDTLDAFDKIDFSIDHLGRNSDNVNEVSLRISVCEARRHKLGMNVSSDKGLNDGNFNMFYTARNLFGRLESLRVNYVRGTKISDGCSVIFDKPYFSKNKSLFKMGVSKENMLNRTANYMTSDVKSSAVYQMDLLGGKSELTAEALWQQIHGGNVAMKIREEFGHHLKCALRHKYVRDTRDDTLVATTGSRHSIETELAGFMGDVNHLKVDLESQFNAKLLLGYSGALWLRAGLIHELSENRRTWITDKFFCGGPGSVRGFYEDGVGRPLGGTMHWGAGLSLSRNLPFSPHIWGLGKFMKIHHFVNAGNLGNNKNDLMVDPRLSVGTGIIMKIVNVRMEINYAVPLRYKPSDVVNHGLQFGIGINFM